MSESMTSYLKMWDRESEKNMKTPIIYPIFKGDTGGDSNLPSTLPTTATISRLEWKLLRLKKHLICIFVSGATPGQCDRGSLRLMDAYMRTQIHLSHSVISSYKGTTWEGALRKLCIPIDKNRLHFDVLHYSASEGVPVGNQNKLVKWTCGNSSRSVWLICFYHIKWKKERKRRDFSQLYSFFLNSTSRSSVPKWKQKLAQATRTFFTLKISSIVGCNSFLILVLKIGENR